MGANYGLLLKYLLITKGSIFVVLATDYHTLQVLQLRNSFPLYGGVLTLDVSTSMPVCGPSGLDVPSTINMNVKHAKIPALNLPVNNFRYFNRNFVIL
jgi:hypothetical protein